MHRLEVGLARDNKLLVTDVAGTNLLGAERHDVRFSLVAAGHLSESLNASQPLANVRVTTLFNEFL
jgi:hypothetical protein